MLLVTLVAVAVSYFMASRQPAEYSATSRLLVSPIRQDDTALFGTELLRDGGDAAQTPNTAAVLLKSSAFAEEAAKQLGGDWTGTTVLKALTIEPAEGTSVLEITATTDDPQAAAAVATEYARAVVRVRRRTIERQLTARAEELAAARRKVPADDYSQRDRLFNEMRLIQNTLRAEGDPTVRLADAAVAPSEPSSRSPMVVAAFSLIGGLALGVAAAMAIEFVRRPVGARDRHHETLQVA